MYSPRKSAFTTLTRTLCAGITLAALAAPALIRADIINYTAGFPNANGLVINQQAVQGLSWNATNNNELVLTTAQSGPNGAWPFEREAVFAATPVSITNFTTNFDFQCIGNPGWMADGITFCIQNQGPNALGGPGGGLGYGPDPSAGSGPSIGNSVAVKFDLFQNWPDPSNSCTGVFTDGVSPVGGIDLLPSGVDLQSGDRFHVVMNYNGTVLNVTITDTVTQASASQSYTINIPATVGGQSAYVGFTGGTGAAVSDSSVLNWYYTSAPLAPQLASFSINPNSICGGLSTQGTLTLQQSMSSDTMVALCCANPCVGVPASVTIPAGQISVTFPVATQITPKSVTASFCASVNGNRLKTSLMVCPIGINTMSVSANYVPAGHPCNGLLTLQVPAAPGPITVQLSSNNAAVASIPASVTVPAGQTSILFPIVTGPVSVNTPVMITGSLNGMTRTTTLTVRPLRVSSVVSSAAMVQGGKSLTATVTLEAPATVGGIVVNLSSNAACLQVLASVVVPGGATIVSFPVMTGGVKASTSATITASSTVNNVYTTVVVTP